MPGTGQSHLENQTKKSERVVAMAGAFPARSNPLASLEKVPVIWELFRREEPSSQRHKS
jgi:hypothetical protein